MRQRFCVQLNVFLNSERLRETAKSVHSQAPHPEWQVIAAFAAELLAVAEAAETGTTVAVVPASALPSLAGALAVAEPEPEPEK